MNEENLFGNRILINEKNKSEESEKTPGSFLVLLQSLPHDLKNFYYKTDYRLPLKNIRVEIVSDINQCFKLWQKFSPQKTIFDTLEFRSAFVKSYQYKPHFILLKNRFENLALLPLEYDRSKKEYVWFGSPWQEENKFLTKDSIFVPFLLAIAPKPLNLNAIDFENAETVKDFVDFEPDNPKYILDLTKVKSLEGFLMGLTKNRRHDLRKDKRRIERQNPEIIINNFSDLKNLVRLSKERFRLKGEDTDWQDPRRVEAFKQVVKLSDKSYKAKMIAIKIGKKIAGVDLIAIFNNCYYTLKCGYNVRDFSGIGNYFNLLEIEDAMKLGMKKIDFLQNNYEWKSRWFQAVPLMKYSQQKEKVEKYFS